MAKQGRPGARKTKKGATVGTGGGITALSVPAEELAEAKLKADALLAVLTTRR